VIDEDALQVESPSETTTLMLTVPTVVQVNVKLGLDCPLMT
jgi:hypothetical protein